MNTEPVAGLATPDVVVPGYKVPVLDRATEEFLTECLALLLSAISYYMLCVR